jgi:EmrB/QacA subfamily drug resistance transporter
MTETTPAEAPPRTRHSPWLVLFTLCLGFFMILLDTTIVNIAIPDMIDSLGASLDQVLWIINAYVLVYAVLLITAGRLGDLYGPKQLFLIGLIIFTLASAACGLAATPAQLIGFRVLQAIGGAMLTPQTLSVITIIFPPDRRGAAFGVWGGVAGVATVIGPTLGGWLVTNLGWRSIFYVNVPVGVFAIVMAAIVMPNMRLNRRHQLDLLGTVLATVGLFLVCYGLIEGEAHDWGKVWGPVTIPMIILTGIGVLVVFMFGQFAVRNVEPLVPVRIFADRNYTLMNGVVAAIAFAMLGLFLSLIIYLQSVLGLTALQAGLAIAPMPLTSMLIAPFAGRFADRIGGKYILLTGLSLWAVGMAIVLANAHVHANRGDFIPGLIVAGVGLGGTFAPLQTIAMRTIEPRMAGAASGFINTTRQLGAVIGSASVGALLQARLAADLDIAARANAEALPAQYRDPFINGFTNAAAKGLQVGAGQTGVQLPPDLPVTVRPAILQAATNTFHDAFTAAMRSTLVLPLVVLAAAAVLVLFVRTGSPPVPSAPTEEA